MRAMLQNSRQDIESLTNSASAIANRIDKGEGTIGKLTKDEKLYTALTNTVASLGNAVSAIDRFKFYITLAGDYMPELPGGGDGKGYFYVTLQPRRDKYYILGIVDDPVGSVDTKLTSTDGVTVKEEKVEAGIEFTAQFAKRFGDTAVRAGITENSLGVGVDRFFLDDRMKLSLDGWDFRVDEFRATNPHFRIGADYFLFKHLFVSCGLDNLFNEDSRSVFMGGGVRFLDEDFKYIFGSLPSIPR
jgi:phospholipid/cholesterol/gamma-HCH transport system substrate-binding protein